jgi:hypothetical protein
MVTLLADEHKRFDQMSRAERAAYRQVLEAKLHEEEEAVKQAGLDETEAAQGSTLRGMLKASLQQLDQLDRKDQKKGS